MIRCIAMDDEPLALEQLTAYIAKVPYLELVAACSDAYDAMKELGSQQVDAIFADINMPDLNGLDLVRSLEHRPLVVFTTAYADYALEGYQVEAVDYLLKPFGLREFAAAADKLRRRYDLLHAAQQPAPPTEPTDPGFIYVKTDRRLVRVSLDDIRYVVGMSEYVRIFLASQTRPLITLSTMKRMEETLPATRFKRIHKSYIVNTAAIRSVNKNNVSVGEEEVLPIGEAYREAFNRWVDDHLVGR